MDFNDVIRIVVLLIWASPFILLFLVLIFAWWDYKFGPPPKPPLPIPKSRTIYCSKCHNPLGGRFSCTYCMVDRSYWFYGGWMSESQIARLSEKMRACQPRDEPDKPEFWLESWF